MSLYEERALLKKLESYGNLLKEIPEAYRLRRKLLVRQVSHSLHCVLPICHAQFKRCNQFLFSKKKRELNVPLTSFDATVRRLVAKEKGIPLPIEDVVRSRIGNRQGIIPSSDFCVISSSHHRILDRFQVLGVLF